MSDTSKVTPSTQVFAANIISIFGNCASFRWVDNDASRECRAEIERYFTEALGFHLDRHLAIEEKARELAAACIAIGVQDKAPVLLSRYDWGQITKQAAQLLRLLEGD